MSNIPAAIEHSPLLCVAHSRNCLLSSPTQRGNTALHLACKLGLVDIVRTLCSHNADTSIQNRKVTADIKASSQTPIHDIFVFDSDEDAPALGLHS